MATVIPHFNELKIDPIKVVTSSNGSASDKRAKAKAQMVAAGYSN